MRRLTHPTWNASSSLHVNLNLPLGALVQRFDPRRSLALHTNMSGAPIPNTDYSDIKLLEIKVHGQTIIAVLYIQARARQL